MNKNTLEKEIIESLEKYNNIQVSLKTLQSNLEYIIEQVGIETYCKDNSMILETYKNTVFNIEGSIFYLDEVVIGSKDCLMLKPCNTVQI